MSDPVVGAYPDGRIQVLTKDDYLAGIGERQTYMDSLGFQFLKTVPLEETSFGNHYTMVKTHGTMRLEKTPGQPIDLVHDTVYILFIKEGSAKYVFTVTHEDPKTMMQEQGSFPAKP
jgi:hypothetical protein